VLRERRKAKRRIINRVAQYYSGLGALPRTCMITDISDSGARLYAEADMPEHFTLTVSTESGDTRRACRVVWRLGGEYGIAFTDGAR